MIPIPFSRAAQLVAIVPFLFAFQSISALGEELPPEVHALAFSESAGLYALKLSGELSYPTPYILENLEMTSLVSPSHLKVFTINKRTFDLFPDTTIAVNSGTQTGGERILSLGEGFSGLVPYLRSRGFDAYGLDLVYDDPEHQQNPYIEAFSKNNWLIAGDATDLSQLTKNSYDLIVSHKLFEYLRNDQKKKALWESFQVLKPGGVIAISATLTFSDSPEVDRHIDTHGNENALLHDYLKEFVKNALGQEPYELDATKIYLSIDPKAAKGEDFLQAYSSLSPDQKQQLSYEDWLDSCNTLSETTFITVLIKVKKKPMPTIPIVPTKQTYGVYSSDGHPSSIEILRRGT